MRTTFPRTPESRNGFELIQSPGESSGAGLPIHSPAWDASGFLSMNKFTIAAAMTILPIVNLLYSHFLLNNNDGQDRHSGCDSKLRSEEHTSELQSHSDLVCRPLPAKTKLRQE